MLTKANVDRNDYVKALEVTNSGTVVRSPNEQNYNPSVMSAWQANMDIQYVLNAYACVMYVASYVMKTEKALLKQLKLEPMSN